MSEFVPSYGLPEQLAASLKEGLTLGRQAADDHYKALLDAYDRQVPEFHHRTDDLALSNTRPVSFNVDVTQFNIQIQLGEEFAPTVAVFKFKKKLCAWKLTNYACQSISHGPIPSIEIIYCGTLQTAIMTASEAYADQAARFGAQQQHSLIHRVGPSIQ